MSDDTMQQRRASKTDRSSAHPGNGRPAGEVDRVRIPPRVVFAALATRARIRMQGARSKVAEVWARRLSGAADRLAASSQRQIDISRGAQDQAARAAAALAALPEHIARGAAEHRSLADWYERDVAVTRRRQYPELQETRAQLREAEREQKLLDLRTGQLRHALAERARDVRREPAAVASAAKRELMLTRKARTKANVDRLRNRGQGGPEQSGGRGVGR